MARYIDQLPREGVCCIMIDAFPPEDVASLDVAFRQGASSIYIAFTATLPDHIVNWIRKMEALGCDIYAKECHFLVIDMCRSSSGLH